MDIKFIGPTYDLPSRPSGLQRTVNMVPVPEEPGNERTAWVYKDVPGLVAFPEPTPLPAWHVYPEPTVWAYTNSNFTAEIT